MGKLLPFFIGALIIILLSQVGIKLEKGGDGWICEKGEWVKSGKPLSAKPASSCGNISVTSPTEGEVVSAPFILAGEARVFESQFNYRLKQENGSVLTEGLAIANAPDAGQFGKYEVTVYFPLPKSERGVLEVFDYSAKDGSEIDKVTLNIVFGKRETTPIKIYFSSTKALAGEECRAGFGVTRLVAKTPQIGRAALEELLRGPSSEEKQEGYITNINPGVKVQKLSIERGIAKVDFNQTLEEAVGGSCRVAAIISQITSTLKQFPTVKEVIISINGRTADILQP